MVSHGLVLGVNYFLGFNIIVLCTCYIGLAIIHCMRNNVQIHVIFYER